MFNFKIRGVLVWLTILLIYSYSNKLLAQCDFLEGQFITFMPSNGYSDPDITTIFLITDLSGNILEASADSIFNSEPTGLYSIYEVSYFTNSPLLNAAPGNNIDDLVSEWLDISNGIIVSVCSTSNQCYVCENETLSFNSTGGNITPPYSTLYAILNMDGDILNIASSPVFPSMNAGNYCAISVNYNTDYPLNGFVVTNNILNVESQCYDISSAFVFEVCNSTNVVVDDIIICAGETGLLSATNSNGGVLVSYLWNTGQTTQSIFVTPLTSQNYSVTATNSEGCITTDNAFVTVNQPPIVNLGDDIAVCQGSEITLTAGNQPGNTYLWNTGATTPSITETVTSNSIYSVTVTDANTCSGNDQISVNSVNCLLCEVFTCPAQCTECDGLITFTSSGGNTDPGYFTIYALVNSDGIIVNMSTNNQFAVPTEGIWGVFGINYLISEGINGLAIGESIFAVNGSCFDISDPLIERVCFNCYPECDYFTGSTVQLTTIGGNTDPNYETRYILTDGLGTILSISSIPNYENLIAGSYFVYGINYYINGIDNLYSANMVSEITGTCYDLSNPYGFTVCVSGSIGDYVWFDADGDGLQDTNESGMEGVIVKLYDELGNFIRSTMTDATGYYIFDDLGPGDYYLIFENPDETIYLQSPKDRLFNDGIDSDAFADGQTGLISLGSGEIISDVDAGFYKGECITGMIWEDNLGNPNNLADLYDILDFKVEIMRVDLISDPDEAITGDEELISTIFTDSEGNYSFSNVPIGQYYIVLYLPADKMLTLTNVGGNEEIDNDFYFNTLTGEYRSEDFTIVSQTDNDCMIDLDGGIRAIINPLPTEMLLYEASWNENKEAVQIDWSTMNEINLDHYLIERKEENKKLFEEVSQTMAKGSRDLNEYRVFDANIGKGLRYLYRLRPFDKDGNEGKSYVASVLVPGDKMNVYAYPNPVNDFLNIDINGKGNSKLSIEFMDYTGRNVMNKIEIEPNYNSTEKLSFDLIKIPQGQYIIKVISGKSVEIIQVSVIK